MGKIRCYRAYLSISASGPLLNAESSKLLNATQTDMRPRALAELAHTTADVDYLERTGRMKTTILHRMSIIEDLKIQQLKNSEEKLG